MDPSPVGPATTGTPVRQGQKGTSLALVARDDGCATSIARHGRSQRPTARLRQPAQSAADSRWHCLDPAKTCGSCGSGSPRACAKADYTSCAAPQLCRGASPIRHRHHRHSRLSRPCECVHHRTVRCHQSANEARCAGYFLEAFRDRTRTNQALEAKGWPVVVSPVPLKQHSFYLETTAANPRGSSLLPRPSLQIKTL